MDLQPQPQENTPTNWVKCVGCERDFEKIWIPEKWGHVLANPAIKRLENNAHWASELREGRCPDCFAVYDALRREEEVRRQQQRFENAKRGLWIDILNGEKPYERYTFEKYDREMNPKAFDAAIAFDPTTQNAFFYGPPGVGKTHLSTAIARRCLENKGYAHVFTMPSLMREMRGHKSVEDEEAVIKRLASLDVLVLDDLGVGRGTEFMLQILQEILEERDNNYRYGLVITSNHDLNFVAEKMGDKISSRIAGMCRVVKLEGKDRRLLPRTEIVNPKLL